MERVQYNYFLVLIYWHAPILSRQYLSGRVARSCLFGRVWIICMIAEILLHFSVYLSLTHWIFSKTDRKGEDVFKSLYNSGLHSSQASKCGELLTMMLTKCWPPSRGGAEPFSQEILTHVLTGQLWPCFFERFGEFFLKGFTVCKIITCIGCMWKFCCACQSSLQVVLVISNFTHVLRTTISSLGF